MLFSSKCVYLLRVSGGDLFTDRLEQQALLEVLMKTEVDLAWPTATSQEYLRERWGWT